MLSGRREAQRRRNSRIAFGRVEPNHRALFEQLTIKKILWSADSGPIAIGLWSSQTIQKVIALKDILQANSSIEAINKTLKYRYLYIHPCHAEALPQKLADAIQDYNYIRPHGSLAGQTPYEAYTSVPPKDHQAQMTQAKTERMDQNRAINCKICA
jgi:transposase InsO family protein